MIFLQVVLVFLCLWLLCAFVTWLLAIIFFPYEKSFRSKDGVVFSLCFSFFVFLGLCFLWVMFSGSFLEPAGGYTNFLRYDE